MWLLSYVYVWSIDRHIDNFSFILIFDSTHEQKKEYKK